ncbi:unnamed protein product [Closterium sp. NIES-53]
MPAVPLAAKTPIDHQKRVPHFGDSRTRMGVGFRGDLQWKVSVDMLKHMQEESGNSDAIDGADEPLPVKGGRREEGG